MSFRDLVIAACLVVGARELRAAEPATVEPPNAHAPLPAPDGDNQSRWDFPALRAVDDSSYGTALTRTMALLATSTPEHRNHVRVLIYGQSLSKQSWSIRVRDELVRRFPNAEIEFHNRAIGGFVSTMLKRTLEHDVIPLYPDLVILHDFGREDDYEDVIRAIRTRTTAEIAIQNDPVTPGQRQDWHDKHSWTWMPELARRWGLELIDIRQAWADYLADQKLAPQALLNADNAHLNQRGNFVWAETTLRHLRFDPARAPDPHGLARTWVVAKDVKWTGGKLVLPFDGNRVDLIAANSPATDAVAGVRIDGRFPSQFPSLMTVSRPNADPNRDWPWDTGAAIRVDHPNPLVVEDWTIVFREVDPQAKSFTFEVTGSVTGFDGKGSHDAAFVSRSGRVAIQPGDWFVERTRGRARANKIAPGYQVTFHVEPRFADAYGSQPVVDATREVVTTIAQGLPPGRHTLELSAPAGKRPALAAIRIYRPLAGPLLAP